jgi:hypothetical protein
MLRFSLARFLKFKVTVILLFTFFCQYALAADAVNWRYTVRPGDNLINFGKAHLINPDDWKILQRINHIKNPHYIPVGKTLLVPVFLLKQGPASAEVIVVSGHAKLQKTSNTFQMITVGQKLSAGTKLVTKENSKVVLRFADGSETTLSSNSVLVLDTLSIYSGGAMVDTKLRLQQGQIETHANPNRILGNDMQIITPSAIAAVRGTKFRVRADVKSMKQETLDGEVVLAALGKKISVKKGYGSLAEKGKPPIQPVVLLPAAELTQLKTSHITLPISFDMPRQKGAVAWMGKVSPSNQFKQVVAEAESQGNQLVFTDVPDGQYYLSVRAKDKLGLAGYDAIKQFDVNARPFAPVLMQPTLDSTVRTAQPELKWDAVNDVKSYLVEVAPDAGFEKMLVKQRVDKETFQLKEALVPGQYFWRVASIGKTKNGADDLGPFVNKSQFNFKALPPKPDISQLQIEVVKNRVFVTLADPLKGLTYEVDVDNEVNNQSKVWVGQDIKGQFNFLLKEYGPQTLLIKHVDGDGSVSPEASYKFDAYPQ